MTETYSKLRLELIIERLALKRAGRVLEDAGLMGYTIVPAMGGFGGNKRWQRGTDISTSQDMVVIVSIGDKEHMDKALYSLGELLGDHIGVLSVTEVQVLRPARF